MRIKINYIEAKKIKQLCCLESILNEKGGSDENIKQRIKKYKWFLIWLEYLEITATF